MEDVPGSLDPDNLAPEAEVSQLTRCVQVPQSQGEGRRNDHLQNYMTIFTHADRTPNASL